MKRMERRRGGDGEGGGGRGEGGVTVVTAALALATACLMVQGVVGAATSNPLRASHLLTVDQYAPPSPPYNNHGLLGFYGRRSSNDGSSTEENVNQQQHYHQYQQQQEQQINRKFQDDSHIYRSIDDRHNRRDSLISFSANDLSIGKVYDNDNVGTISRDSAGTIVTQNDKERSKHLSGKNEYDGKKPGGDDYVAPPTEMDEPFVADETFQDEGPGSVEIYKLDLFEGRKSLPSPMSNVKGVIMTGLTGLTLPTPTSIATSATMRIGNNKSKMPKKSSGLSWKVGKSSNGLLKSTTITMVSTGNDNDNDGGATGSGTNNDTKDLHGRSNFLDSELRSEVPSNVEAFGVGGVPELQVGCEGLEAPSSSSSSASSSSATSFSYFSPSSRKLKRSVEKTEKTGEPNGKAEQPTAPFNVVPISLDLDYDISAESYEEMDELFKLKKLESEPKRNKENRGDIDAMVNDFLIQDRNVKERLPVRGDLGNSSLSSVVESIKNVNDLKGSRRKRSSSSSSSSSSSNSSSLSDTNTSGYVSRFNGRSRKLLWVDSESDSGLWGYGENEGLISSDELDTEQRRRQQQQQRQQQDKNIVNVEIDKIREEYDRLLKQQRIVEEERLRRVKELESRRSPTSNSVRDEEDRRKKFYEDRTRMEELRRREEARRREEEYRRRNLITEDRRDLENRRREWMAKRRKEEEEMERRMKLLDEERRRREELEERRRMKDLPIANLQLARYNFNKNESRENEEEERRKLEREYMERNRLLERQRMEDERRRQMLEEERRRREEERRREAMTEERRIEEERKRMEEERRRGTLEDERRKIEEERRRQEFEKERWRMENEKRKQMSEEENRRRMEMERSRRYRNNVTRDRNDDEEYRRKRIMEERQRRLDEERKLQEYVRRNQPVELRKDERRNEHWNVSQRWREREEEKRKKEEEEKRRQMERAMEAVRQMNRSNRYPPGSGYERREHGPSAPTYIDPRVSLDEARRRQEIEALERRRKEEEEQKRRILEEERRREIEYKREQSRRYEEERKKMETFRLEEDRRTQEMIENQRRRGMTSVRRVGPTATVSSVLPVLGNLMENRRTTEIRQRERLREQQREQQRIREEEEKKRRAIIARQNARRQHENSAKAQWEREDNRRIMNEQYRRHEEARLNALPVSARIIVQPKGSLPHSRPTFTSRAGFENEINFPNVNRRNNGVQTTIFPPYVRSPNPCVWAVVHCCPTNTNRLVTCFESLGCPGVNWDPNPCRGAIADAAREEVMRFYNSQEEDDRN